MANRTPRRSSRGVALLTAFALGAAAVGAACNAEPRGPVGSDYFPEVSSPDIKQARWKIKTHGTGAVRKVTGADKKRLRSQRGKLADLVRDVYDSLFLFPSRKNTVLRKHFSKPAARRVIQSRAGVPEQAELVRTRSRRAVIGIQPNGARRAAAVVTVRANGQVRNRIFRIAHRATLWLQRSKKLWRVIGFEVRQGPAKPKSVKRKRSRDGKKSGEKRSKHRRRQGGGNRR